VAAAFAPHKPEVKRLARRALPRRESAADPAGAAAGFDSHGSRNSLICVGSAEICFTFTLHIGAKLV
jgi:hypothetical protein